MADHDKVCRTSREHRRDGQSTPYNPLAPPRIPHSYCQSDRSYGKSWASGARATFFFLADLRVAQQDLCRRRRMGAIWLAIYDSNNPCCTAYLQGQQVILWGELNSIKPSFDSTDWLGQAPSCQALRGSPRQTQQRNNPKIS